MRVIITVDSIQPDDLDTVVNAHRIAVAHDDYDETPRSIEATESQRFNNAMWVAVEGSGFKARTIPLSPYQARVFTERVLGF